MANGANILVVDPNQEDLQGTMTCLQEHGYTPVSAEDSTSALRQLFNHHPEALIIDIAFPADQGWSIVRQIKDLSEIPIIVTSEEASRTSLKTAFDLSVDGYIIKPLKPGELIERLGSVISRGQVNGSQTWFFQHDDLCIDWRSQKVKVADSPVSLTATEFKLLSTLVEHRGWVLTHEQILNQVWGSNYIGDRHNVKLYIWYLRHKIESNPSEPRWILTKRGVGYQFAS